MKKLPISFRTEIKRLRYRGSEKCFGSDAAIKWKETHKLEIPRRSKTTLISWYIFLLCQTSPVYRPRSQPTAVVLKKTIIILPPRCRCQITGQ